MAAYSILLKVSVERDFDGIPKNDLRRLLGRIKALEADPRLKGCEKLTGQGRYRLRQGRYRILCSIEDHKRRVTVVKVGHRKNIYR